MNTLVYELPGRLLEWLLGSLILAPVLAAMSAVAVYALSAAIRRKRSMPDG